MNYRVYTSPEAAKRVYRFFNEIYRTGKPQYVTDHEIIRKDGTKRIIEMSVSLMRSLSGEPIGFRGVGRDVTERIKAEQALKESEERYRSLFENVSDLIFYHDLDGNLVLDKCNFSSNLKWANFVERMGSTNIIDMVPENIRGIFRDVMTQLVKNRSGQGFITLVDKQGEKSHMEYWHHLVYDESGRPGVQAIARDVTDKLMAEHALTKSEEKYRTILQSIDDGYFETDEKGNINFVNEAFCTILKSTHEMILGKNLSGFTDEQTGIRLLETLDKIFESDKTARGFSMELTCKDLGMVSTESSISLMRDKKGNKTGFRGVMRDITKRKALERDLMEKNTKLEEMHQEMGKTNLDLILAYNEVKEAQMRLIQSEKMATIGQLAAGVAHEINNPMGFITSNIGTLGKYTAKISEFLNLQDQAMASGSQEIMTGFPEKRKALKIDYILKDIDDLVTESLDGAQRVKKIVLDLKSFSRKDEPELNFVDINSCIESSLNMVWNEIKYKAEVIKELGMIPETLCFAQQLNQVFMNILVNASQAIEDRGEIRIRSWNENGSIFVAISDTGSGIPEENLPKLFEPFFTTKAKDKGTGLGLAIVCDIVRKHKGYIKVESVVNQGTTFTIELPVVKEREAILVSREA
jgi:two-component system NtrC family sensor kinase